MKISDFIYSLAHDNKPKLEYFDFKDEFRKYWTYEKYDNDECSDFYQQYLRVHFLIVIPLKKWKLQHAEVLLAMVLRINKLHSDSA